MKVSIAILLYNTKKEYFHKCLNSIYNSTLKDFEVIVIDDGSSIDYSDLIEKYGVKYVKTENRGILPSRMYALSLVSGDYVAFVDSDDYVSVNYHMPMIEKALSENDDIVINDWAFDGERYKHICQSDATIAGDISLEGDEILKEFVSKDGKQHSYYVLWNKIFKKELILKAKACVEALPLPKVPLGYAEDVLLNFFAWKNAKKVANVHTGYYFYRIQPTQSTVVSSKEKLKNQIYNMNYVLSSMEKNVSPNKYEGEIRTHLKNWRELMSRSHYSYAKQNKYTDLYDFIKESYGVSELKPYTYSDGKYYNSSSLLASNFDEIDLKLKKLFLQEAPIDVDYDKNDKYVVRTIEYLCKTKNKKITYKSGAEFKIPKRDISLKNKIINNKFVYAVGMKLFKKGSKIRAFLKQKL